MSRPVGSKNSLTAGKTGPHPGLKRFAYDLEEAGAGELKTKILDMFAAGEIRTLAEAAKKLKLNPIRVYYWRSRDEVWREQLAVAEEVLADRLEEELLNIPAMSPVSLSAYVRARIFLLTGLRPWKYRDNMRLNAQNSRIESLIGELKKLAGTPQKIELPPVQLPAPPSDPAPDAPIEGIFRTLQPVEQNK